MCHVGLPDKKQRCLKYGRKHKICIDAIYYKVQGLIESIYKPTSDSVWFTDREETATAADVTAAYLTDYANRCILAKLPLSDHCMAHCGAFKLYMAA